MNVNNHFIESNQYFDGVSNVLKYLIICIIIYKTLRRSIIKIAKNIIKCFPRKLFRKKPMCQIVKL